MKISIALFTEYVVHYFETSFLAAVKSPIYELNLPNMVFYKYIYIIINSLQRKISYTRLQRREAILAFKRAAS
ncbi:hypothetical protein SDC9_112862 [bioreactor metagenome]|uniref:Uncharacterized protein n=1 Tax=bioreactor metagenome TaxID=1076179 RepID=A0A645BLG0_9ZZZZ